MSSSQAPYLIDWRKSFSLVRKNVYCKNGTTFRGSNAHVEMPLSDSACISAMRSAAVGRSDGTAKPGPTAVTDSRIARIKKLQRRTRNTKVTDQSNGGTSRGAHPTVENATAGVSKASARAQLFGSQGSIPSQTSGVGGSSSDVIYFKKVFDRVTLNQPTTNPGAGPDIN